MAVVVLGFGCASRIVPDGILADGEWKGARSLPLSGGGEMRVVATGEETSIAIAGEVKGIVSILVATGDEVRILHASAALGTGVYRRDEAGTWRRTSDFTWEARDLEDAAARQRFSEKHGWLANAVPGGADREFRISRSHFPPPLRVVVARLDMASDPPELAAYPAQTGDDALKIEVHQGLLPETLRFDPTRWGML